MDQAFNYYHNETKEKLKMRFPILTDEDLDFREGRERELMEMLADKLEMTHVDLVEVIENLSGSRH